MVPQQPHGVAQIKGQDSTVVPSPYRPNEWGNKNEQDKLIETTPRPPPWNQLALPPQRVLSSGNHLHKIRKHKDQESIQAVDSVTTTPARLDPLFGDAATTLLTPVHTVDNHQSGSNEKKKTAAFHTGVARLLKSPSPKKTDDETTLTPLEPQKKESQPKFQAGDRVEILYEGKWWTGEILLVQQQTNQRNDYQYKVYYHDDKTQEEDVEELRIRPVGNNNNNKPRWLEIGTAVWAQWDDGNYYSGVIASRRKNKRLTKLYYTILFDDGDVSHNVPADKVVAGDSCRSAPSHDVMETSSGCKEETLVVHKDQAVEQKAVVESGNDEYQYEPPVKRARSESNCFLVSQSHEKKKKSHCCGTGIHGATGNTVAAPAMTVRARLAELESTIGIVESTSTTTPIFTRLGRLENCFSAGLQDGAIDKRLERLENML